MAKRYDPNQPRKPRGQAGAGQWTVGAKAFYKGEPVYVSERVSAKRVRVEYTHGGVGSAEVLITDLTMRDAGAASKRSGSRKLSAQERRDLEAGTFQDAWDRILPDAPSWARERLRARGYQDQEPRPGERRRRSEPKLLRGRNEPKKGIHRIRGRDVQGGFVGHPYKGKLTKARMRRMQRLHRWPEED